MFAAAAVVSGCAVPTPSADYYAALRTQCESGSKAACAAMPEAAGEAAQESAQIGALGGVFKPAPHAAAGEAAAPTY
jgi:hypothetical protein